MCSLGHSPSPHDHLASTVCEPLCEHSVRPMHPLAVRPLDVWRQALNGLHHTHKLDCRTPGSGRCQHTDCNGGPVPVTAIMGVARRPAVCCAAVHRWVVTEGGHAASYLLASADQSEEACKEEDTGEEATTVGRGRFGERGRHRQCENDNAGTLRQKLGGAHQYQAGRCTKCCRPPSASSRCHPASDREQLGTRSGADREWRRQGTYQVERLGMATHRLPIHRSDHVASRQPCPRHKIFWVAVLDPHAFTSVSAQRHAKMAIARIDGDRYVTLAGRTQVCGAAVPASLAHVAKAPSTHDRGSCAVVQRGWCSYDLGGRRSTPQTNARPDTKG